MILSFTLNGDPVTINVEPNVTALELLRDILGLTGSKEGCGYGDCGACTIIVNDKAVNACLLISPYLNGKNVITIEGILKPGGHLDPIQETFLTHGAVQCGFCTPGAIMSAKALLKENPTPSDEEIKKALSGNLCRCSGYSKMIEAVKEVSCE